MNKYLLLFFLSTAHNGFSQCSFSAFLDSNGNCIGSILDVKATRALSKIVWYDGNMVVKTATTVAGAGTAITLFQLKGPAGQLCVDGAGNLYVADIDNNRVVKWSLCEQAVITAVSTCSGTNPGNICNNPTFGAFVDRSGNIYASNELTVQKWAPGAANGITAAGGQGAGVIINPFGIYVDSAGNVYEADPLNNCVQKWSPGAANVITAAGGNGAGSGANQLNEPTNVYVDAGGNVYVSDIRNNRVQKWAPGATSGITVAGGNGPGTAANQINFTANSSGIIDDEGGIYVDATGNLYVADYGNNRIQKWTPGATSGITVAGGNGAGSAANQITAPLSVFLDSAGNIYISDSVGVQEWALASIDNKYTITSSGTYTVVATDMQGNTTTTNSVTVSIASLTITATDTVICSGQPVTFTATATNAGDTPAYVWQLNGKPAGGDSSTFYSSDLINGDSISCTLKSSTTCFTPASSSIGMTVHDTPSVSPQRFDVQSGQSIILSPAITGNIASYSWSPSLHLSDSAIKTPVATPPESIVYKLSVVSADGCKSNGLITVKVFSPIGIPNAFTPNDDGHNDIFYIKGGFPGSIIKDFSIFNRWGQLMFHVNNVLSDDPASGWNGNYKGSPAPTGSYIYMVTLGFLNGSKQVFKGTLELIR